ncbi:MULTISPECIES: hypothetical protein [Methylobacterium]|uniref:hypothetical protein n=1 Tax=Methylobacterium TaxID=407 RepID=UPI000349719F|nr:MULTISPECIES: hypothetical protein [Methylobacterium]MBN4098356.1 hypothetical protein [Methylobacterium sp. OT2]UIN36875.1 hypothetical protein LXM90_10395 [Methylobacterium oryzae]
MSGRSNVETLLVLKRQPITVDTGSLDRDGVLLLANGLLVAVLVRLDALEHEHPGYWFLEAGFGRLQGMRVDAFPTLDHATRWVRKQLIR